MKQKIKKTITKNNFQKLLTINFYKNNWQYIILFFLLIFGFQLRAYHIDYPSIGYHNMKENIYLSQAYHMYEGDGFFKLIMFHLGGFDNAYQPDMLPIIAWITLLFWKIFGIDVFWPRLIMVLCSTANIIFVYWLVKLLSKKREIALIAGALMSFMPIGVFFGRNIQPDIPGVTFLLLSWIYFYNWIQNENRKTFIYFSIFTMIAFNLKLTNLIGLIAFIFLIPYKKILLNIKKYIPEAIIFCLSLSTAFLWRFLQNYIMPNPSSTAQVGLFMEFLDGYNLNYWTQSIKILSSFVLDNFTYWYFWFAIIGIFLVLFKYKSTFGKFLIGYLISFFVYFSFVPKFMVRHNYYQAPYLPLVVIASAYLFFTIGNLLGEIFNNIVKNNKQELFKTGFILIVTLCFILLSWGSVKASIDRQFDTQFIGCDVAGKYININSENDEKIFMGSDPSGQTIATLWAAKRSGAWMPSNLTQFNKLENEKNFKWIFLYGGAINDLQNNKVEIWDYISQNYEIAQIGAVMNGNSPQPYYFVLRKGGTFNISNFERIQPIKATEYEYSKRKVPFYTFTK